MRNHEPPAEPDQPIDPDPFAVGLGLIQVIAAGITFLEARRQRQVIQQGQRDDFRSAYFQAKRSLIFFKRASDEFETYMLEGGYSRREFRIGAVRIIVDPQQHQAMRRLHGQIMTTANHMADNLDDLSNFLSADDQANIDAIHERARSIQSFPDSYRDVINIARETMQLYQNLLDDIAERERFGDEEA